ncbi:MAG: phytoene desaturase family protein, partial [Opitutia bacterium]
MSAPARYDAVIIGAGMSGLAAAVRLGMYGRKVLVLERHNTAGGLNSFYARGNRKYDVGLHALTNWVPEGAKGAPLVKLMRQLRIRREELDLCPQLGSRVAMAGKNLRLDNDFDHLLADVAEQFPGSVDRFRALDAWIAGLDEASLDAPGGSARALLDERLCDPLLRDMLLLPTCFYGSALEDDIEVSQFAIMWRSLFREGFARPFIGVRQVIRLLLERCREHGVERRMKCGVRSLEVRAGRVAALVLDDGSEVTADAVYSSAGAVETRRLRSDVAPLAGAAEVGRLGYAETIATYEPAAFAGFGWKDTIVFFCDDERFGYRSPADLVDPRSGVICIPNNYRYGEGRTLDEGWLRVTALANHDAWCRLPEAEYRAQKQAWCGRLNRVARAHLPAVADSVHDAALTSTDVFTPRTVRKFTGHLNGAIYGSTVKRRDGRTDVANLFLIGTDQGFLG